ncbi:DHS-like NAD/FAD-binding domain-containing protein [Rhodocollybia butyracea]|uniref:DHS-like NAD/FAD-binding domain-containing protein n=1 Tax=Rhodocollybia butyracea TaxID=206335 RepID=A0A9P5PDB8_9AGAR|nr:DHS-like NAD/FAD-binding domain-containing protein [Rhodocollybia butyracea]
MTLFLPLEDSAPLYTTPAFVIKPNDPESQVTKVIKTILKAKRIVVICGAGISVKAGIPDFRSSEGLFHSLKRDNPKDALSSGKDLFDASVFNTEHKTALFCQMISRLSDLSQAAEPTPFHNLLSSLDTNGRLLRVYTQNIDALESKSGLSFGVPEFEGKRSKPRNNTFQEVGDPGPSTTSNRAPRCIPLHGTLQQVHCQICNHSFPLSDYLPSLVLGVPPECPECAAMERTRQLVGKRPRGVGKLRPSVVLYNEAHKDGEGVGEIVQKDLIGTKGRSGADLLLVVGTSLRVPGTKRMVREFSKAVHSRGSSSKESTPGGDEQASQQQPQQPLKSVYLNLDFPVPTRDWEGVFDAWIQGDAQSFAHMLQEELDKEVLAKGIAVEKRRKKEEEMALATLSGAPTPKTPAKKRKVLEGPPVRRKKLVVEIPIPPRGIIRPYHGQPPLHPHPKPSSMISPSSPLTVRIPPRPRPAPLSENPEYGTFIPASPPSTPIKKSSIGRPPPTPEYTPGRTTSPKFRTLTSIPRRDNQSFSTLHTRYERKSPSGSTSSSSLTEDESESELIDDDAKKSPWRDSSERGGTWQGQYCLPFPLPLPVSIPVSRTGSYSRGNEDVSMMDVNDFRDRLGTSCLRTTQVQVGEGG